MRGMQKPAFASVVPLQEEFELCRQGVASLRNSAFERRAAVVVAVHGKFCR